MLVVDWSFLEAAMIAHCNPQPLDQRNTNEDNLCIFCRGVLCTTVQRVTILIWKIKKVSLDSGDRGQQLLLQHTGYQFFLG